MAQFLPNVVILAYIFADFLGPIKNMSNQNEILLAKLDRSQAHKFHYVPNDDALGAIRANLDLKNLQIDGFRGELNPEAGGWRLSAFLDGKATQSCVISGAPVHTALKIRVIRTYVEDLKPLSDDISLEEDFDDTIDIMPKTLDLNELINESVALNIPSFPKIAKYLDSQNEWSLHSKNFDPSEEIETHRPFEGLDKLFNLKKT